MKCNKKNDSITIQMHLIFVRVAMLSDLPVIKCCGYVRLVAFDEERTKKGDSNVIRRNTMDAG